MPQDRIATQKPPVDFHTPPSFVCLRIDYAQTVRVFVAGELDVETVPRLDASLRQAAADAPLVVLDLRRVEFVAGCGVKLLLEADARIRRTGGRLYILNAPDRLHRLLGLIGATGALDFGQPQSAPAGPSATEQLEVG